MGIEREIDKLGRIVLPISYRQRLNLTEHSVVRVDLYFGGIRQRAEYLLYPASK